MSSEETPEEVVQDSRADAEAASPSEAPHASASDADATSASAVSESSSSAPGDGEEAGADADAEPVEEAPKARRRRKAVKAPEPVAEESADEADDEDDEDEVEEPAAEEKPAAAKPAPPAPAPTRRRGKRDPNLPIPVVRAQAKYVRSSARKARLVCDNIRGKSVEDARAILAHTPRAVARDWSKLLESAVANAEHNHELVGEDLYIKAVTADEGPTIKRFRPRAMGRATKIRKRTSHLTILLTPKD